MSETGKQNDRLVKASEAARVLGMSRKGVLAEIRKGTLAAKKRIVQHEPGCKPKTNYVILESELARYIADLPDAGPATTRPTRRGALTDVIQFV